MKNEKSAEEWAVIARSDPPQAEDDEAIQSRKDRNLAYSYGLLRRCAPRNDGPFFNAARKACLGVITCGRGKKTLQSCVAVALSLVALCGSAQAIVPTVEYPVATLRALDKITARVEELGIPIGRPTAFGTLSITIRACRATPPEDTPESAAFVEVVEIRPGANDAPVFRGWMFASSPSLSAMEHPVYDLWVTGCKGTPLPSSTAEEPAPVPDQPVGASPAPAPDNAPTATPQAR